MHRGEIAAKEEGKTEANVPVLLFSGQYGYGTHVSSHSLRGYAVVSVGANAAEGVE